MSLPDLLLAFAIVATSAALQGTVGFGFNLITVPLLALIDIRFVPGPIIMAALALSLLVAQSEKSSIDLRGVSWAVVGRLPGTFLGILTLKVISSPQMMAFIVGCLVCFAVLLSSVGLPVRITTFTLIAAGVISGFMGTTVAIGGPALILLFQHQPGGYIRGTLSGYFVIGASMSLLVLAALGKFGWLEFTFGLRLLPGVLLGFFISKYLKTSLDNGALRVIILAVSGAAGIFIVLRSLL